MLDPKIKDPQNYDEETDTYYDEELYNELMKEFGVNEDD